MAKRNRVAPAPTRSSTMELRAYAVSHALSMVAVLSVLFYGLFVWFGGYDPSFIVARYPIAFSFLDWTFIFGLVQTYAIAYVVGWVFARLYNSY